MVSWARQAELCGEYPAKGSPIFVEGRLQSRNWETADGQKRSTIEVVAQNIQFLGRVPRVAAGEASPAPKGSQVVGAQGQLPAEESSAGSEMPEAPPPEAEGELGEVPF